MGPHRSKEMGWGGWANPLNGGAAIYPRVPVPDGIRTAPARDHKVASTLRMMGGLLADEY